MSEDRIRHNAFLMLTHDESHGGNRSIENPYRANRLRISMDNLPSLGLLKQHSD
jgi:hypothetical protein